MPLANQLIRNTLKFLRSHESESTAKNQGVNILHDLNSLLDL